ncbi:ANTAR domain-containing protein, partial [Streptomyces sp. ODS05-4]|uniref:ANTAR domain-containing protein n=1 Tax=Streptomyces sp. ODS05-4 TaxID=2944939 RepID=UPI0035B4D718
MNSPQPPGAPVPDDGPPDSGRPAPPEGAALPAAVPEPRDAALTDPPAETAARSVGRLAATVERLRQEVQTAHAAADGRALVELAKGILVERLQCGPGEAARQLASLAEQSGVPVLELAADILNRTAADRLSDAAQAFLSATAGEDGGPEQSEAGGVSVGVRLRTAESGSLAADDSQAVAESLL